MPKKGGAIYRLDRGLSDREVYLVGEIVVEWGAMEHEVFSQTLRSYPEADAETLPPAMNNLQFSQLLRLWRERVVDQTEAPRLTVLQQQHDAIVILKPYREALVHGMWHWSGSDLGRLSTTRVRKKEVITTHFSHDDLADFAARLADLNFKLRFPAGPEDLVKAREEQPSASRRLLVNLARHRVASDWLSNWQEPDARKPKPDA